MRDSFTFYRSFMEALDDMDAETYKKLMQAITHYAMDGIEPDNLSIFEKAIFISWKANVDASNKRKDNGKLGGRPSKKPLVSDEKTIGFESENHRLCNSKPNKKEKEEREIEVEREIEGEKEREVEGEIEKEREEEKVLSFSIENDCRTQAVQRVVEKWNGLSGLGVKPVSKIASDSQRYKLLAKRITDNGEQGVMDAIERIRGSDFLLGKKTDFLITFDWFVKPSNFAKVADGNYDNKTPQDSREAFYEKWRNV